METAAFINYPTIRRVQESPLLRERYKMWCVAIVAICVLSIAIGIILNSLAIYLENQTQLPQCKASQQSGNIFGALGPSV